MAASSLSENDVLKILGIGFVVMWRARNKKTVPIAALTATAATPAQAQAGTAVSFWNGLSTLIGTSAAVGAAQIANTGLSNLTQPTPYGTGGTDISSQATSSGDGVVLNPPGNVSPIDYLGLSADETLIN